MRIRAWPVLARYGARLEPGKRIKLTSLQLSLANKFKNSDFYSMNFPSFQETIYQADGPQRVLLVSPHGADSQEFLAAFPAIQEHPQMQAIWPLPELCL
ncbi:MAG: hypothetical protein NTX25_07205 [Proteobacteria bacterium]|nr:hypothetical protein [Pseudomonadota bacterium]